MKKYLLILTLSLLTTLGFGQKLPFQGKLIEAGIPVDGTRDFEFSIANPAWSETHTGVTIIDGLYFVTLGSTNPLPDSLFYGVDERQLSILVDGIALSPVILHKPLSTPFEGNDISLTNSEGDVKAQISIADNINGWRLLNGRTTGNILEGFRSWEGDAGADLPFLSYSTRNNILAHLTLNNIIDANNDTTSTSYFSLRSSDKHGLSLTPHQLYMQKDGIFLSQLLTHNRNGLGYSALFDVRGPSSINVEIGSKYWENPDLPWISLQGTNSHEAVQIGCYDSEYQEGFIAVRANNNDFMKIDATGISGSLPIEIQNGANITGNLNINGDITTNGNLELYGPNKANIAFGRRSDVADIPRMDMIGTNENFAFVTISANPGDESGYVYVAGNDESYWTNYTADGISSSGDLTIHNNTDILGDVKVNGTVVHSSDRRLKKDIQSIGNNTLKKIQLIEGVSYNWRQEDFPEKNFSSDRQIGVIAQELEAQFPELVKTGEDGYKSVNYNGFTAVLLEAVKELNARVEELETENTQLKTELSASASTKTELQQLKTQVAELVKLVHGNSEELTFTQEVK